MTKNQNLQDSFLNQLRKEKIHVVVYLTNGVRLRGVIKGFDSFVVLLKEATVQMIYKHAISTVVPEGVFNYQMPRVEEQETKIRDKSRRRVIHLIHADSIFPDLIFYFPMHKYKNPLPTVDLIIEYDSGIILIKRKNPPYGWALPGGFVDYGESLEAAAVREAREETGLDVHLVRQFHAYSEPERDSRFHTITVVYIARAKGIPRAGDDAADVGVFAGDKLPEDIVFDHRDILMDYFEKRY